MKTNQYAIDIRPRKFSEVYGHASHIIDFKNRSKNNAFPQVMMFTGHTGSGKSTLAGIVSSVMNCHNPIKQEDGSYEPCGECDSCKDIESESFSRDVIYKNASKMSKEDVNNLEKTADSSPWIDSKKIIIIEEAQELSSKGAKGALLKLTEKPRKDVHFILLTMDESEFHDSIPDRCQVYKFKPFKSSEVYEFLGGFIDKIDPEEKLPDSIVDVANLIADNSHGSLRKAIQDLERAVYSEAFTTEKASEIFDYITEDVAITALQKLIAKDGTFFSSLPKDILSFYNYTFAILMNAQEASLTGNYGSKTSEAKMKKLLSTGMVPKVLETYIKIQESTASYNKSKIIKYHFMKFFTEEASAPKIKEELPTRRRRTPV